MIDRQLTSANKTAGPSSPIARREDQHEGEGRERSMMRKIWRERRTIISTLVSNVHKCQRFPLSPPHLLFLQDAVRSSVRLASQSNNFRASRRGIQFGGEFGSLAAFPRSLRRLFFPRSAICKPKGDPTRLPQWFLRVAKGLTQPPFVPV